ncbi:8079_t:CDS:2, partial [Gigaspora rosea]
KRRPLNVQSITETAFEEASRLCIGMQFENWEHVNSVLLAYGQQKGFMWRIENSYPDKNSAEHCVKNRLYHLFWMSPLQQSIYIRHHNVILTDNTARTNKLLEATNNLAQIIIYFDCDTSLGPAIKTHLVRSLGSKFVEFQSDFFSGPQIERTLGALTANEKMIVVSVHHYLQKNMSKRQSSEATTLRKEVALATEVGEATVARIVAEFNKTGEVAPSKQGQ